MKDNEINHAIERYNLRLKEHGVSQEALGWGKKGRAQLRYEMLISQWNLTGASILDFGCGFGGLLELLIKKQVNIKEFTGIDINTNFIEIAKDLYSDIEYAKFIEGNLFKYPFENKFNYIFSSGVFNHKLDDNFGFIKDSFTKFDKISNKGFAVNFLSNKVEFQYDYTYHANPAIILELAYSFSNRVVLRNDYMPYEFTIFVFKDTKVDKNITVYNDYVDLVK